MSKPHPHFADIAQHSNARPAQLSIVRRALVLGLTSSIVFASMSASPVVAASSSVTGSSAQPGALATSSVVIVAADKKVSFSVKTSANLNLRQGASATKKSGSPD